MTVADGFAVRLVAAEPVVRQPVAIEFDSRGRLWTIQYLQYPNPAGLERVKVDRYSRTVYDRVPEPPPRGPRGADRISILDLDGEGRAVRAKDFVAGLNLASGLAFGHGGVFVLQAPYLLFYPDRNGDDAPDSDPEVLLSGFGLEDASAVANSLMWGPDGWLYGCQGSTVTANICGLEFQQGIWRYHPITKKFELFCDGGGNTWGLDFDAEGELFYSTNYGGHVLLHGVQGGYYWKAFEKHGPLSNPFAYGWFEHAPHANFRGGHVTVGGIVYQGDAFPERLRGKFIAADLLGHAVYWHTIDPVGATFRTAHGGELLLANDPWFAPTDVTTAPDGSIYVADWHDKRTAHPDPDAEWDRTNGRIYRIEALGTPAYDGRDLADLPSDELVRLLAHPSAWYARTARRLLADRRDGLVVPELRRLVAESRDKRLALEALWALYVSGGFDEGFAARLLDHRYPALRRWVVRLLGDEREVSPATCERFIAMARTDTDVRVRAQLACSARRLPAEQCLPIVEALMCRDEDASDPYQPLLLWWAVEQHCVAARDRVLQFFAAAAAWEHPIVRDTILSRLMRRYAAEGGHEGFEACERLLASSPSLEGRKRMIASLDEGWRERSPRSGRNPPPVLPPALERPLVEVFDAGAREPGLLRLLTDLGYRPAREHVLRVASDSQARVEDRVAMLGILAEVGSGDCVGALLALVGGDHPIAVQSATLATLQRFDSDAIAARLLEEYARANDPLRARIRDVLFSRQAWALAFLQKIDQGVLRSEDVPVEQLRRLAVHHDDPLDALVLKHWGTVQAGTPEEKLAEVRRLNNDLRAATGDPARGRELYKKHCATCHRLFDEGEKIGPDLTHANRKDRDYLLVSLVDPSAVIRKEYQTYVVATTDGRVLTGLIVEASPTHVTLAGSQGERTVVPRSQIDTMQASAASIMPENLVKNLTPDELRDLFRYLESDAAVR